MIPIIKTKRLARKSQSLLFSVPSYNEEIYRKENEKIDRKEEEEIDRTAKQIKRISGTVKFGFFGKISFVLDQNNCDFPFAVYGILSQKNESFSKKSPVRACAIGREMPKAGKNKRERFFVLACSFSFFSKNANIRIFRRFPGKTDAFPIYGSLPVSRQKNP